jgi:CO/xanthine dehydrogenase FAD-binding subunit
MVGPGRTVLADDEILLEVQCEALPRHAGAFEKVGHRRSLVISTVCVTALVELDAGKRVFRDLRLAVAGVGPVPRRIEMIEDSLRGKPIDAGRIVDASFNTDSYVASRTRQDYRREVLQGFVVRAIVNAARRAGADPSLFPADIEAAYA